MITEHYLFFPLEILNKLLNHCSSNHNHKRENIAEGRVRRDREERQNSTDKEVKVCNPPELLKQGLGKKRGQRILSSTHIIVTIILKTWISTIRVIAIHFPWETRSSNEWMLIFHWSFPTWECMDSTEVMLPSPPPSHISQRFKLFQVSTQLQWWTRSNFENSDSNQNQISERKRWWYWTTTKEWKNERMNEMEVKNKPRWPTRSSSGFSIQEWWWWWKTEKNG